MVDHQLGAVCPKRSRRRLIIVSVNNSERGCTSLLVRGVGAVREHLEHIDDALRAQFSVCDCHWRRKVWFLAGGATVDDIREAVCAAVADGVEVTELTHEVEEVPR